MSNSYTFQTNLFHNKHKVDPATGAVSVPIQHASTFHQSDIDSFGKYDYARSGNPTREALEDVIAELEEGTRGFAFASGMAAISTAFMLLSKGRPCRHYRRCLRWNIPYGFSSSRSIWN